MTNAAGQMIKIPSAMQAFVRSDIENGGGSTFLSTGKKFLSPPSNFGGSFPVQNFFA